MKSDENELFLKRLNGLKMTLEKEQEQGYDKEILISRLNEIKEFLTEEAELEQASTEERPLAIPLDLRKVK